MNRASILANFPGIAAARIPQDLVVFFDDFLGSSWSATADATIWDATVVAQAAIGLTVLDGTSEAKDEMGGVLSLVTEATAGDGCNLQVNGEAFGLEVGIPIYFETRINFKDISNTKGFIGLSNLDADIIAEYQDLIGFSLKSDAISAISAKDSDETTVLDIGITEADDDWIRLAFFWDGIDTVYFYKDPNDKGDFEVCYIINTTDDILPDNEMLTPSIEFSSDATATAETVLIDYVLCAAKRYHE